MAALTNIGGTHCSMPQSFADAANLGEHKTVTEW